MKKCLITLGLFLSTTLVFSQITVKEKVEPVVIGEIKNGSLMTMTLRYFEEYELYYFGFLNKKYSSIVDYQSFSLNEESKNDLYVLIKDNIDLKEKKEFEIPLANEDELTLTFINKRVQFSLWDGYKISYSDYFKMNKINDLYGIEE